MSDIAPVRKRQISHETSITIALVLSLCAGAYFTGTLTSKFTSGINHNSANIQEMKRIQENQSQLIKQLSEISRDNKSRLDFLEKSLLQYDKKSH